MALLLALAGMPMWVVCLLLLVDFALCRAMDSTLMRLYANPPRWYLPLRTRLTVMVMIAVAIVMFSSLGGP